MQKLKLGLLVSFILPLSQICHAEKIYSWKDASGSTHYTNNPALVPLTSDKTRTINIKSTAAKPIKKPVDGAEIWHNQCATCHNLTPQGDNRYRGIPLLIQSIKNEPLSKSMQVLQTALDDNMDDLAEINLTEAEKESVLQFITKQVTHRPSQGSKP